MHRIAVIGLGKAGLPIAGVIANSGLNVVGVDDDRTMKNRITQRYYGICC